MSTCHRLHIRHWNLVVTGVTPPLQMRGSYTGPTTVVDRELQDCHLDVKQYLFFSGIIDKEKENGEGRRRGLYNKQEQIINNSKQ